MRIHSFSLCTYRGGRPRPPGGLEISSAAHLACGKPASPPRLSFSRQIPARSNGLRISSALNTLQQRTRLRNG